jgi:hypothetical protein
MKGGVERQQIPKGNDRKKSKGNSKSKSNGKCGGPSASPQDDGEKLATASAEAGPSLLSG